MLCWVKFIACGAGIIFCGYKLSFLADIICEKTSVTRTIMGFAILAIATSAPEFVTSGASVAMVRAPDFALGDVFGSLIINLGIIALLDLIEGEGPIMLKVHAKQILYAGWTTIFLGVVLFSMVFRLFDSRVVVIGGVGVESIILPFLCVIALFSIFNLEKELRKRKDTSVSRTEKLYGHLKLSSSLARFIFYLMAIVALGIWLSRIAKQIVVLMGWSEVLMGTFFLAVITSLPELMVSLSALKFDVNMAVGNIMGSNFFDMMIIPFCDLLSPGKVFLSSVKQDNLFSGILAVIMLNIFIVGLMSRSRRCFLRVGWDAVSMILCLVLGGFVFFFIGR